ncbi:4Fe-4S dicluster domain-containing protein [Candidatus Colwellia aromaticivorans]|uniref:4Fe-4S dicluster domain-containing protein n=1 Tax=Candidatus Colwellia aromaticivorans TaxID=2267621 RepID=UPI000DF1E385|nr:4Fe-4S dicluster domain-containing protein [Candidatus Colwellia aromaticivorans]
MEIYHLDDLSLLQQHLLAQYQLYQVVKNDDKQCSWQQQTKERNEPLIAELPQSSAKDFFFAEHENLLIFNGEYFQETLPTPAPFVLFGILSCDLTAISYQDQFFKDDPYYQARRQQCLLVGLDCIKPCQQGFCPTVDAGPGVREHTADIILHPLENHQWLLISTNDKGTEAIKGLSLKTCHWHFLTQRDLTLHQCEQEFTDDSDITQAIDKLNNGEVSDSFWQQLAVQCLGCSGCTTLCPTCSCYGTRSITDESEDKKVITQQRFWDSCLYEGFQREASFHNPSAEAGKRVQRFWQHKFGNEFFAEFNRHGCVGCGRCEQTCPGVIGVHSVMKRINNNA